MVATLDAEQLLASGTHPLQAVTARLPALGGDEAIAVKSSFVPAPLVDAMRARGLVCHSRAVAGGVETLIAKDPSGDTDEGA